MEFNGPTARYDKAVGVLGKKWTALIVRCLLDKPQRFSHFSELVPGLSDRLLSQRLQELETSGMVKRRVSSERPLKVEYALTARGEALRPVVEAIESWANEWLEDLSTSEAPPAPARDTRLKLWV